ncbi:hypothetical protein ACFYVR_22790 [Rhodococcus sp. NPDC003318]|uniref:hypothetical protein n=1 Tax=Rhodococcus sp. NPDC003318 TaxID=3364503 RepID=UPI0036AD0415
MASTETIVGASRLGAVVAEFDAAAAAELERCRRALEEDVLVEVTGRAGVGRSAIVTALGPVAGAEVVETAAWDRPAAADPELRGDVVVLALLDPPRSADRAAAAANARLLPVLTKADTLADPDRSAARISALLGTHCLPVTAVGEVRGIATLRDELADRVATVGARRAVALLTLLRSLGEHPALRDPVEDHLASDDGVALTARATGQRVTPADAPGRARHWRHRLAGDIDADGARTALAMHRAAVREWIRGA